jgi:diadenosine tetraphosphate (Ap4A) HIT family hydrolase
MDNLQPARAAFPAEAYALTVQRIRQEGQCFICRVVDRTHRYRHHIVYEDADTIVFLNRYPTLIGYCLVSPRKHVEDWALDLSEAEFLALQSVVHRVARAVAATVPAERIYTPSLGSQQANAHVHWHVAPCRREFPTISRNSAPCGKTTESSTYPKPTRPNWPGRSAATFKPAPPVRQ